ncbi:hypothetical protein L211DRAFT_248242 [Terfezia boudieri ATCC MYA-4762]|uniref:Uncharacterized protein n=1 Tax=Terfezia boudieri ATCC MYA-4762 TaxID=1051890 RepID=A0A3N4M4Q1_9PEZI|nr:hypothetical protein L211DRAFT_248242 [Terfezia boudieri ATCC MYA-4762]
MSFPSTTTAPSQGAQIKREFPAHFHLPSPVDIAAVEILTRELGDSGALRTRQNPRFSEICAGVLVLALGCILSV